MDQAPQPTQYPQVPVVPQVIPEPIQAKPKKSRMLKFFLSLVLVGLFGSMILNFLLFGALAIVGLGSSDDEGRVKEVFVSHNRHGSTKVAILSIEGTILSGEGFFKQQIDHARKDIEDGSLKAIVVRVNSPGGTITGSDYMLYHLNKLAKETNTPIVVSMGGLAASGGYYVSMCVGDTKDSLYAEPSTWTGSIGVIIPHYNAADLMEKWGIQDDHVASHRLKGMGGFTRKMTDEERKIFQVLVDAGFKQFLDAVESGRPTFHNNPDALKELATGQVFTAKQAVENGLIDRIGFIEDAIDRAIRLAELDKNDVKVVKYKAEPRLSEILFGENATRPSFDVEALLETTTPRAYYLCTWLPGLASNAK
jgi:protease-4